MRDETISNSHAWQNIFWNNIHDTCKFFLSWHMPKLLSLTPKTSPFRGQNHQWNIAFGGHTDTSPAPFLLAHMVVVSAFFVDHTAVSSLVCVWRCLSFDKKLPMTLRIHSTRHFVHRASRNPPLHKLFHQERQSHFKGHVMIIIVPKYKHFSKFQVCRYGVIRSVTKPFPYTHTFLPIVVQFQFL